MTTTVQTYIETSRALRGSLSDLTGLVMSGRYARARQTARVVIALLADLEEAGRQAEPHVEHWRQNDKQIR